MYDPVHGMYHNFYQNHLAEDMNGAGDGPVLGHWVSKDFLHWAQLPVAVWNDRYVRTNMLARFKVSKDAF